MKKSNKWYVYIIECKDGKLYTGMTNDLENRIKQHNRGHGCKFTKYRIPVRLLHNEKFNTRGEALSREAQIKNLTRDKKLELIAS